MCGIAGFLSISRGRAVDDLNRQVRAMADTLVHRGPDDAGTWADTFDHRSIALGFRRLSIIDLSAAGHQPMVSHSGRSVIIFNGEIYNFEDIRRELLRVDPGIRFHGHSDTEVMLEAIERWGFEAALKRFNGMFAIALWDREERRLFLARDRAGEKPLYYGWSGETFFFGSELKAFHAHPDFHAQVDRGAVALLARFACIPHPHCIYTGFRKLMPGHWITLRPGEREYPQERPYWSLREFVERGASDPRSQGDQLADLHSRLRHSVSSRMVADVPVGAFLSGGIDSSLIVSLMQACSSRPVKTFSIGFAEASYNEAPFAEKIAKHLGTDHTELILDAKQAQQVIPKLPAIYDEPFADSSQIPTFLVSQLASQYVRVALTGDAGDEVFAGYPRQQLIARMRRLLAIPSPLRRALGGALSLAPDRMRRFHKLGAVVKQPNARAMFAALASHWPQGSNPVLAVDKSSTVLDLDSHWPSAPYLEQIIYLDSVTYLPDDILVKVDRAAMANSLETRVPFLDHELMEFVWNLPLRMRVRGNIGKWVLKQILSEYVSRDLFERPKSGFSIPLGEWLRGDLRDWAEDLLSERRLREDGYFDAHRVRSAWHAHLSGADLEHKLWNILAFQAWLRGVGVSQRSAHA